MISDLKMLLAMPTPINNHQSEIINHKLTHRRLGVTLMEVLIAAGVTAVGMFGVLALIPVAGIQVQRGITEDRKAIGAKNALAEFHIRGYRNPATWFYVDGSQDTPTHPIPGQAYCIDPRFVAYQGSMELPYAHFSDPTITCWMPRLTVWNSNVVSFAAIRQMADDIFTFQDDLSFIAPSGNQRTLPPYQMFSQDTTSNNTRRLSAGEYSWFATVVPKHGANKDEYVLSVVICQNRDVIKTPDYVAAGMTTKQIAAVSERVFKTVSLNAGQGTGGGEVRLGAPTFRELDGILQNSWIMLAGNTTTGSPDFKWYRIIGVDQVIDSNGNPIFNDTSGTAPFSRNLTLQGPDWQRPEWFNGFSKTEATLMSSVVGVFERTIRLESTGLWSQ